MAPRALCIGINKYEGGYEKPLKGCESDVEAWKLALGGRGFQVRPPLLNSQARREAILGAFREELHAAQAGELVVMVFAGHGSWVEDTNGDESDHRDEVLCPYDIKSKGPIRDDELSRIVGERPQGVRCLLVVDACHAGTVSRLHSPPDGEEQTEQVRFMDPGYFSAPVDSRALQLPLVRLRAGALLLSACGEREKSEEGVLGGKVRGAFSYYALKALEELRAGSSYRDWLRAIRMSLPNQRFRQSPDLVGTEEQKTRPVLT